MKRDSAAVADRVRPGEGGTTHLAFTTAASAFQKLRDVVPNMQARYVSFRVTANAHIIFGDDTLGAPTATDMLFTPEDGIQDWMLVPSDTGFRIIGDADGEIFIIFSSRT